MTSNPDRVVEIMRETLRDYLPDPEQEELCEMLVKSQIAALEEAGLVMLRWRPMSEAPKTGERIILWWGNAARVGFWLDNNSTAHPWAGWSIPSMEAMPSVSQPDCWMPFPEIPTTYTPEQSDDDTRNSQD